MGYMGWARLSFEPLGIRRSSNWISMWPSFHWLAAKIWELLKEDYWKIAVLLRAILKDDSWPFWCSVLTLLPGSWWLINGQMLVGEMRLDDHRLPVSRFSKYFPICTMWRRDLSRCKRAKASGWQVSPKAIPLFLWIFLGLSLRSKHYQ